MYICTYAYIYICAQSNDYMKYGDKKTTREMMGIKLEIRIQPQFRK